MLTAFVLLAITLVTAAGLPRLRTDVGYRAFLGESHPSVQSLDAFVARFGGGIPLAAVWSCAETDLCAGVLDSASLEMADAIEEQLRGSPWLSQVRGPASATLVLPTPIGPLPRRFVANGVVVEEPIRRAMAERALVDPGWSGLLVSPDGQVGAIVADLDSSDSVAARGAYADLDLALAPFEARGIRFARVGGAVEFVVAGGELERATAQLIPAMVLLVGLTLWALFRSAIAAATVLVSVGTAVLWCMGVLGWLGVLGWAQNSLTQTIPPLILVIGVCDGIHLVSRYADISFSGSRDALLERAAADVGPPCLMTSVTTAAGFLSFGVADLQSFAQFGALAAFGVMAALVTSFSALPLLLHFVRPERVRRSAAHAAWERALQLLVSLATRRTTWVLAGSALLAAVSTVGFLQLRVDASFEDLYGEESAVVKWAHFVAANLRRPDTLEIDLTLPDGTTVEDPTTLEQLASSADGLAAIETLGPAQSLADPVSWTHRLLRGDDPAFERTGETAEENAALLAALAAFSHDEGATSRWLDSTGHHLRISVQAEKTPQDVLRRVMDQVASQLGELPVGWRGEATGPLAVVHDMIDDIRTTQLESFATAALAVWLLVALFLRSPVWAAMALVPTALPVLMTTGAMGLAGIPLDVGSAMVAAVVLGIAVDDAIHVLVHFRKQRQIGESASAAVVHAIEHVGRALATTSLALCIGFSALAFSPWQSVASFGAVSAVAILGALVAVLLVLPALVLAWERPANAP